MFRRHSFVAPRPARTRPKRIEVMQFWKIRREINRLVEQISAIPATVYEPVLQRRYDRLRSSSLRITEGSKAAGKKIAIFLIYQPNGIPKSIYSTCQHLCEVGFRTLIVCNTPLKDSERTRLAESSFLVIERPNFGYDFGGYRDAVWMLQERDIDPDEVLFLNDSIWFPAVSGNSLLGDMSASKFDYVGVQEFGDITAVGGKQGFFASYCFLAKKQVWQSSVFQEYWRDYKCSSNKEVTLRRGERGFSRKMLNSCPNSGALFDVSKFRKLVEKLSAKELWVVIQDLVVTDKILEGKHKTMLEQGPAAASMEAMRDLIFASVETKNYLGAAPILSLLSLEIPIIKKNNEMLYVRCRRRILAAYEAGRLESLDKNVLQEIRQSRF